MRGQKQFLSDVDELLFIIEKLSQSETQKEAGIHLKMAINTALELQEKRNELSRRTKEYWHKYGHR